MESEEDSHGRNSRDTILISIQGIRGRGQAKHSPKKAIYPNSYPSSQIFWHTIVPQGVTEKLQ